MKKLLRWLLFFVLIGIFLALAVFLGLMFYYRSNFPVNTWINGVYCTGKTVEQVNEELADAFGDAAVRIADADGNSWEIAMSDAGIRPDYTEQLRAYINGISRFSWLENMGDAVHGELAAQKFVWDDARLRECFEALPFVAQEREREEGVAVRYTEEGYVFSDGNQRRLDQEKACAYLESCLKRGQTMVDLWEGACYTDLRDSNSDRVQRELWRQICEFTDRCGRITYDMGAEQIVLTPDIAAHFLKTGSEGGVPLLDAQGNAQLDEEAVRAWVEELARAYDTCGTEKAFEATRGETVSVKYGTYGTRLDVEAEEAYLLEALRADSGEAQVHVPAYVQQGYVRGLDDIGETYIEIDMTEQKMYYYVDGEIALETDVVTGNNGRTPAGIHFVYGKQRNRTLRGADYASFVKYWMPVNGNIGIHDASWRNKFGGQIYKTNGSHGCINTPTDIMSQLYDMAEIGTPVIMFY